jgi:hypothetical protein
MDPATYILLEGIAFAAINDPCPTLVYPQWAALTTIKMIDATFLREKNYFLSYKNIKRACFRMFDAKIGAEYKVSNNPTLTGWNSTMSILDILTQLQDSHGKPTMMTLYQNNITFRAAVAPTDSPEMLFYRIEQCQEIQRIRKLPYSDEQIIANTVQILIQSNIFPLKEFDTWEATAQKTYPSLKTFMHEAYGRRLTAMALHSTSGQNGYSNQMMYHVFDEEHGNESDKDTVMTITQTAAIMAAPGSTSTSQGTAISAKVAAAINQLSANQTTMMAQMAAMTMAPLMVPQTRATVPRETFHVPPIPQVAVPMHQPFAAQVGFSTGCSGHRVGRGQGRGRRGGQNRTPFADAMRGTGAVAPPMTNMVPYGGGTGQLPAAPGGQPHHHNAEFLNIYKQHNNWNVCFSCGFDVEDRHTPGTCPFKKWNHQVSYTRNNAQQFIAAGYDPCTKGMHKSVLPSGRRNT